MFYFLYLKNWDTVVQCPSQSSGNVRCKRKQRITTIRRTILTIACVFCVCVCVYFKNRFYSKH